MMDDRRWGQRTTDDHYSDTRWRDKPTKEDTIQWVIHRTSTHPCRLHQLLPMSVPDRVVLQLCDGSQWRDHVLDDSFDPQVRVPRPHLLVQTPDVLRELLTIQLHLFAVYIRPRHSLPVSDTRRDDEHVVPQLLEQDDLLATLLQLLEVGKVHLEQTRWPVELRHLLLHAVDLKVVLQ